MVPTALVAAVGNYEPRWLEILGEPFMRYAFLAGALVAISAGLLGYFVVIRQHAFAAHALAHIGFPGATAAVLLGWPVTVGLAVFCVGGGLAMGLLGKRMAEREVSTGTILAFATGLGFLFNALTTKSSVSVTNVLFGNLTAITTDQLVVFAIFTVAVAAVMAVIARPLTFASVNPDVAEAKGVPVRALGIAFLVLLALVITMAVQVVGTLLLFALVVTPSATALALTARPARVAVIGTGLAFGAVAIGLVVATMFNLPPSFCIVTVSFVSWLVVLLITRERRSAAPLDESAAAEPSDFHDALRRREIEWAHDHADDAVTGG